MFLPKKEAMVTLSPKSYIPQGLSIKHFPLEFVPTDNNGVFVDRALKLKESLHKSSPGGSQYCSPVGADRVFTERCSVPEFIEILNKITDESKPAFTFQVLHNENVPKWIKQELLTFLFSFSAPYKTTLLFSPIYTWSMTKNLEDDYYNPYGKELIHYIFSHMPLHKISSEILTLLNRPDSIFVDSTVEAMIRNPSFHQEESLSFAMGLFVHKTLLRILNCLPNNKETFDFILKNHLLFVEDTFERSHEYDANRTGGNHPMYEKLIEKVKQCYPEEYASLPNSWVGRILFLGETGVS